MDTSLDSRNAYRVRAAALVVVLDPAGRLFVEGFKPSVFLVTDQVATRVSFGADFDEPSAYAIANMPPEGTELLVVAPGCKPNRSVLKPGRSIVRLEAGFRVRLSILGIRPEVSKGTALGMRLKCEHPDQDYDALPKSVYLRAAPASVFDEDRALNSSFLLPIPKSGVFEVLIPVSGQYEFDWAMQTPNSTGTFDGGIEPLSLTPDMEELVLFWNDAAVAQATKFVSRWR